MTQLENVIIFLLLSLECCLHFCNRDFILKTISDCKCLASQESCVMYSACHSEYCASSVTSGSGSFSYCLRLHQSSQPNNAEIAVFSGVSGPHVTGPASRVCVIPTQGHPPRVQPALPLREWLPASWVVTRTYFEGQSRPLNWPKCFPSGAKLPYPAFTFRIYSYA